MKQLPLSNSPLFALVDDNIFNQVKRYKWRIGCGGYVVRTQNRRRLKPTTVYLHKVVLPDSRKVDHKFHNLLDNRRRMLRPATHRQNCSNRLTNRTPNKSSRFKGVTWYKSRRKWGARIRVNYRRIFLGLFESERDAARAYNASAVKYFGKFSHLNRV